MAADVFGQHTLGWGGYIYIYIFIYLYVAIFVQVREAERTALDFPERLVGWLARTSVSMGGKVGGLITLLR